MRRIVLLSACAVAAVCITAANQPSHAEEASTPGQPAITRPWTALQAIRAGVGATCASPTASLAYNGGNVMQYVAVYTIFWIPSAGLDGNYMSLINRYFDDVGASDFFDINTQYFQTAGPTFILNASILAGTTLDTTPYPMACTAPEASAGQACTVDGDCDSLLGAGDGRCEVKGSPTNPLGQKDIVDEVLRILAMHAAWGPPDLNRIYFLYTEPNVESTAGSLCTPGVHCPADKQYCAYHYYQDKLLYAYMPYVGTWGECAFVSTSPNNNPEIDEEISTTSHEHFETVTDPQLTAWFDCDIGGENGDKCRDEFGKIDADGSNIVLNGNPYIIQKEWSNVDFDGTTANGGCVKHFNAARLGERVSPVLEDASLGVLHYRGRCSAGTIGAPCNVSSECGAGGLCGVTAATADDTTVLRWNDPDTEESDLYRGTIAGNNKGTLVAAQQYYQVSRWKLNTFGVGGGSANCFHPNIPGTRSNPGMNYSSGVLTQTDDPDPDVGTSRYYLAIARVTQGGSSVSLNDLGCANPGLCNNRGWCILGSNPGAPCSDNSACEGGGTCQIRRTYCSTDIGVADLGGCGAHQVCAGGANMGRLCNSSADCLGSSCPPLPASTSNTDQLCLNLTGAALSRNGCINKSQPKSVLLVSTNTCLAPAVSIGNACDLDADCDVAPGSGDGACSAPRQCP